MDEAIYKAVQSDDPMMLRQLVSSGGNANAYYQDLTLISAKSILHMCCEKGRTECVKVLLECGADLTIQDTWYQTPLMYCMLTQYHDIADVLLTHDNDMVDIGDKYGKCAIHIACEVGSVECLKVLLKHGADVNSRTYYGVTALITVCGNKDIPPETVTEIVGILLEHKANCNLKCYRDGRSALQMAMISLNVSVIELLLAYGADTSTLDKGGRCPTTTLLWYHRKPDAHGELHEDVWVVIVMLIQAGAKLNISRYEHSNALCMATLYQYSSLVEYFLYNGADQNVSFYCGITPLQIATRNKDLKTLKILLGWKSDLYRQGRVVRGDLDYNTDVFHLAIDIGAFDVGILLADVGYDLSRVQYLADWSKTPPDTLQRNPTMLAYFRQRATAVQRLFQLTVLAIRNTLSGHISENAACLPLPKSLISAVQICETISADNGF